MKRNVVALLSMLFLSAANAAAQNAYVKITGEVGSALTQEGVARAVVKVLAADSAAVLAADTTRYRLVTERGEGWETTRPDTHGGAEFAIIVPERARYRLVVEAEGFEPYCCEAVPAGKGRVEVPAIFLIPAGRERMLDEATVAATQIKMFYKGDTLVYNADAFNATQSESLRKLVERLPGVEMKDGVVRIHGKRVDGVLLSGKDFFNGNIDAALDNLPAYIVSRVKVYDKAGGLSELTGRDMHDGSYVMDVRLKRKYTGIWMAKLAADGGTDGLWGAQGYLMRFDDRQMFSVNADVNNFNQDRQITEIADMADTTPWGQTTSKAARLSYYIEPNATWRFTADGSVGRKDTRKRSDENSETYLVPANLMTRSSERFDGEDVRAAASVSVRARKKGSWQHSLGYAFDFLRSRCARDARSLSYYLPALSEWDGLPLDSIIRLEESKAEGNALLHSLFEPQLTRSRSFAHRPEWKSSFVFGSDLLNVAATLKHSTQTQRDFSNYRLTTYADGALDARRRFRYRRDYALDFRPEVEWVHKYERLGRFDGVLTPYLRYAHRYGTMNHPEYRLERMSQWADQMGWGLESLGRLPQSDWKSLCLDEANSFCSTEREEKADAGIRLSHKIRFGGGTSLQLDADEALYYQRRSLDYRRDGLSYRPRRDGFFFRPGLTLKWKHESRDGRRWMPEWEAGYQGQPAMPALTQLLPIRDESDPLNRFVGNEALGNSFAHRVTSAYRLEHVKSGRVFDLSATYRRLHGDIATQSFYDAATGIRTYQPVNTSRTHGVQGRAGFTTALDRKKRFYLSSSFSADYYQAENRSFLSDGAAASAGLLRGVGLTPYVSLRATVGSNFNFNATWNTTFRHASQPGLHDSYRETTLRGDIGYSLPWGIRLETVLRTIFYAGNSLPSLNRTVTNWDATLSKYLLGERLGILLTVHDILGQASTYRSEVTATGRFESYTDVLPRYFMLSLSYRFDWVGKNRQ